MYELLYCYFYEFGSKKGYGGGLVASAIVTLAIEIHLIIIFEIVYILVGFDITGYLKFGSKLIPFIIFICLTILISFYYHNFKSMLILLKYKKKYHNYTKHLIPVFYLLIPLIVASILTVNRQHSH